MPRQPPLDAPGLLHHLVARDIKRRGDFVEQVWKAAERTEVGKGSRQPKAVLEEVTRVWCLDPARIVGPSRERRISRARREFLLKAYERTATNPSELGRRCGIGHASVRAAIAKARSEREKRQ